MKRIALISLLMLPLQSLAVPVEWTLDGYIYNVQLEVGRATGSFVYDADTGEFSNISLTTTGPGAAGHTYTQFAGAGTQGLNFFQAGLSGEFATIAFHLQGIDLSMLTNAGGVLVVNGESSVAGLAEYWCIDASCHAGVGSAFNNWYLQGPAPSTLTGVVVTAVDEPGMLALLAAAVGWAAYRRRRA